MFPGGRNESRAFAVAVVSNIAAKVFELLDKPIYELGGIASGHTLKHLSASLGFIPLMFLVYRKVGREPHQEALGKSA